MGGVWDDSASVLGSHGGECVTEAQAQLRYDAAVGALELDVVQLSNDGGLVGFGERGAHSTIRRAAGAPFSPQELLLLCIDYGQCHTGGRLAGNHFPSPLGHRHYAKYADASRQNIEQ
jgi:hypothetical protein